MGKGVYHEIKVIKCKVFTIVCMFFENGGESFERKYGFEDVEVFSEEEELLDGEFLIVCLLYFCNIYGGGLNICFRIECIYLM